MAKKDKKKEAEKKIVLERVYNVPLRREFLKVPRYKRGKKAVNALRSFLVRHMKSDKIFIGKYANLKIWEHGIKNPPHHIKIVAKKDEDGKVIAELEGAPVEKPIEPVKKKTVKKEETKDEKTKEEKPAVVKVEEKAKEEKAREIEKEEIKELQREQPKQHAPKEAAKQKDIQMKPTAPAGRGDMRKP
ncbi:MAG: 50S ribosomal protein L31e [Candidatus Woesearchaeota archaeon]